MNTTTAAPRVAANSWTDICSVAIPSSKANGAPVSPAVSAPESSSAETEPTPVTKAMAAAAAIDLISMV